MLPLFFVCVFAVLLPPPPFFFDAGDTTHDVMLAKQALMPLS